MHRRWNWPSNWLTCSAGCRSIGLARAGERIVHWSWWIGIGVFLLGAAGLPRRLRCCTDRFSGSPEELLATVRAPHVVTSTVLLDRKLTIAAALCSLLGHPPQNSELLFVLAFAMFLTILLTRHSIMPLDLADRTGPLLACAAFEIRVAGWDFHDAALGTLWVEAVEHGSLGDVLLEENLRVMGEGIRCQILTDESLVPYSIAAFAWASKLLGIFNVDGGSEGLADAFFANRRFGGVVEMNCAVDWDIFVVGPGSRPWSRWLGWKLGRFLIVEADGARDYLGWWRPHDFGPLVATPRTS